MGVLSDVFGNSPQVQIIEVFAENYKEKLFVADIVRMTELSKMSVHKYIKKLTEEGIIKKCGKAGIVQFYQMNCNNPKVKVIMRLENYIVSEKLEELLKEQ